MEKTSVKSEYWHMHSWKEYSTKLKTTEAVAQRDSVKKVFLKTFQNSQENTYSGVSFSVA